MTHADPIRIGISSCLLGQEARFDGGHKRDRSYVLKKDSPSCGVERVKVYDAHKVPARSGQGLFAAALRARHPFLPVEEEGRLSDPRIRDNFIERVFACRRLQELFGSRWTVGTLVRFHTAHKLTLMAHAPKAYQALGQLVARAKQLPRPDLQEPHPRELMLRNHV